VCTEVSKEVLSALRENAQKDIWLVGGGELVAAFLREKALDEIWITQLPVLLGEGRRLFPEPFPETHFALQDVRAFTGGVVSLRYYPK
jgi:dihydrofolate reductase